MVNKIYDGVSINEGIVYLTLYDDECELTEARESVISEKNEYRIVNLNIQEAVVDALGEDILTKVSDNLYRYYRMGINGWYYDIPIDVEHIPSLIEGETIRSVKLVKNEQQAINCNYNRICLFTNKNRILYNFIKSII